MLAKQVTEVTVEAFLRPGHEFTVIHGGEVGALGPQGVDCLLVGHHLGEPVGGQHPAERGADARLGLRVRVVWVGFVGGNPRLGTEELGVDCLSGQTGCPFTEDAHHGGVQVGVTAEHTEDHRVVRVEFVLGKCSYPGVGVAPAKFSMAGAVGVVEGEVERRHGHWVGEHLAHVGPGPERVALRCLGAQKVLLDHRSSPPFCGAPLLLWCDWPPARDDPWATKCATARRGLQQAGGSGFVARSPPRPGFQA